MFVEIKNFYTADTLHCSVN